MKSFHREVAIFSSAAPFAKNQDSLNAVICDEGSIPYHMRVRHKAQPNVIHEAKLNVSR